MQREDLYRGAAELTGLARQLIDPAEPLDLARLRERLSSRVLGQLAAVDAVVERAAMYKAGLCARERPRASFIFVGPTGTGKTELARVLAGEIGGGEDKLIRIDMSELDWYGGLQRLLGGDGDRGMSLADALRAQPYAVVLLDEFEKADPRLWDVFLPVLDTGFMTDYLGRRIDARGAVFIVTSNAGAQRASRGALGFGNSEYDERELTRAIRQSFRPELINRFDRIVEFRPLSRETLREIVGQELGRLFSRRGLRRLGLRLEIDQAGLDFILERAFTKDMGARAVRRTVEQLVATPLAMELAAGGVAGDAQAVRLSTHGTRLRVAFIRESERRNKLRDASRVRSEASVESPKEAPKIRRTVSRATHMDDVASDDQTLPVGTERRTDGEQ